MRSMINVSSALFTSADTMENMEQITTLWGDGAIAAINFNSHKMTIYNKIDAIENAAEVLAFRKDTKAMAELEKRYNKLCKELENVSEGYYIQGELDGYELARNEWANAMSEKEDKSVFDSETDTITGDEAIFNEGLTPEIEEEIEPAVFEHGKRIKTTLKVVSYQQFKNRLSNGLRRVYKAFATDDIKGNFPIYLQGVKFSAKVGEDVEITGLCQSYKDDQGSVSEFTIQGCKVVKDWSQVKDADKDDETFLRDNNRCYISAMNKDGAMIPKYPSWLADWREGSHYGKNRMAGDRNSQAKDRLAQWLAPIYEKWGNALGRQIEKAIMEFTGTFLVDCSLPDANEEKVELANQMADTAMEWIKESAQWEIRVAGLKSEELWAMVPDSIREKLTKEWEEKMQKRQVRICHIEDAQKLDIEWVNKALKDALIQRNWREFGSDWIKAKENLVSSILVKHQPYVARWHWTIWLGINNAVEFGITNKPNIKGDLVKHLGWMVNDNESRKCVWVATMAAIDIRYQEYMEESGRIEDSRLGAAGVTLDSQRWMQEYADKCWFQNRDKEIWHDSSRKEDDAIGRILKLLEWGKFTGKQAEELISKLDVNPLNTQPKWEGNREENNNKFYYSEMKHGKWLEDWEKELDAQIAQQEAELEKTGRIGRVLDPSEYRKE